MEPLRNTEAPSAWEAEVVRLTDDRHLAAWSDDGEERVSFAGRLGAFLQGISDAEVIRLFGGTITGLDSLCHQLERSIPGAGPMRRRISGPSGVASRLRHRTSFLGRPPVRSRYIIWHDVDVLIESDRSLFGAVADSIAGVAAESEYASDDLLLLTRAVYVGGRSLAEYAGDSACQLRSWLSDGAAEPFWRVVTGIDRPPVMSAPIGVLVQDAEGLATSLLLSSLDADGAMGF